MPINTLNKVINYFGSATQVAKVLGIKQQSVSDWYRGRSKVPLDVALHLDFLMRGEVDWKELVPFETAYRLKDLRLYINNKIIFTMTISPTLLNLINLFAGGFLTLMGALGNTWITHKLRERDKKKLELKKIIDETSALLEELKENLSELHRIYLFDTIDEDTYDPNDFQKKSEIFSTKTKKMESVKIFQRLIHIFRVNFKCLPFLEDLTNLNFYWLIGVNILKANFKTPYLFETGHSSHEKIKIPENNDHKIHILKEGVKN